jgi:histidinol-phosphate aminotransferase
MGARLAALNGIEVFPTDANFILFRVAREGDGNEANRVFLGLKERGILIKNLDGHHPLLKNCLRVTVGKPDENMKFLMALQASLNKSNN